MCSTGSSSGNRESACHDVGGHRGLELLIIKVTQQDRTIFHSVFDAGKQAVPSNTKPGVYLHPLGNHKRPTGISP